MQGLSFWGITFSIINIFRCFAEIGIGTQDAPEALQNILDKIRDPQQQPAEITLEEIKDVFQSPNKDDEFNLNISTIIRNSFPSQIKKNYNKYLPVLFGGGPSEDDDGRSLKVYDVNVTEARARRLKRQSPDEKDDICERDEILHVDGECYHILSQGPCEDTELVLMDPETRKI
ncbi:hypothetical protein Anas_07783 [Armadillidium nasatum]|uniref:Uncharacterized protein n=1 Tax=Armadillidium nasatum TaxID=96803 RepID=A0A5N5SNW5_9CRUS|nr:hypothetical protein Anas_07783 [Armadillidium nasatum]